MDLFVNVLDLFSGIGGFSLGLERAGMRTVAFCETDRHCRAILETHWPGVPKFRDVRFLDRAKLSRLLPVHLVCGGFPCQDASIGNVGGKGTAGQRTGLYTEPIRIAGELGCPLLMENVPGLLIRGFGDVLRALAEVGFDAEWECISARDVGADHLRERVWIMAYPRSEGRKGFKHYHGVLGRARQALALHGNEAFGEWRSLVAGKPALRSVDGVSVAMERRRLHGVGNSVVPQIPEIIGRAIMQAEGLI